MDTLLKGTTIVFHRKLLQFMKETSFYSTYFLNPCARSTCCATRSMKHGMQNSELIAVVQEDFLIPYFFAIPMCKAIHKAIPRAKHTATTGITQASTWNFQRKQLATGNGTIKQKLPTLRQIAAPRVVTGKHPHILNGTARPAVRLTRHVEDMMYYRTT